MEVEHTKSKCIKDSLLETGTSTIIPTTTTGMMVKRNTKKKGKKLDVAIVNEFGDTPVHIACAKNDFGAIELLIKEGMDINIRNKNGQSPLIIACEKGYINIARLLLESGADVHLLTKQRDTALHVACTDEKGGVDLVELLLQQEGAAATINIRNKKGQTPLIIACDNQYLHLIEVLLKAGADPNVPNNRGETPLFRCCRVSDPYGKGIIHERLMDAGADINIPNKDGVTPLMVSCKEESYYVPMNAVFKKIASHPSIKIDTINNKGDSALHIAASHTKPDQVKLLLNHGATVNIRNKNGLTPLMIACGRKRQTPLAIQLEMITALLEAGADASLLNNNGESSAYIACEKKHIAISLEIVKRSPVQLNNVNKAGNTLYHSACTNNHVKMVEFLLKQKVPVNVVDNDGISPLIMAVSNKNFNIANIIVKSGLADCNAKDMGGRTALHFASLHDRHELIKLLLGNGAMIDARDNKGYTPLHLVCKQEKTDVIPLLVNSGAQLDSCDDKGETILESVYKKGVTEVISILEEVIATTKSTAQDSLFLVAFQNKRFDQVLTIIKTNPSLLNSRNAVTMFLVAFDNKRFDVVEALLNENPALLNFTNSQGETLLHEACIRNSLDMVQLLVSHGAPVNVRDKKGKTAFSIAVELGNEDIMKSLLNAGCDLKSLT